jgi:hypothetical protein
LLTRIETIDLRPLKSFNQDLDEWVSQNVRPDLDHLLSQARTWDIGTEYTKATGFIAIPSIHNDPWGYTIEDIFGPDSRYTWKQQDGRLLVYLNFLTPITRTREQSPASSRYNDITDEILPHTKRKSPPSSRYNTAADEILSRTKRPRAKTPILKPIKREQSSPVRRDTDELSVEVEDTAESIEVFNPELSIHTTDSSMVESSDTGPSAGTRRRQDRRPSQRRMPRTRS